MRQERSFENDPRFETRLDPVCAEFAAHAGGLESAERRLLIAKHAVDGYAAGLDRLSHPARALDVGPARESMEAEARVVGDPDRIFLGYVGDDREDRAENLFLGDGHIPLFGLIRATDPSVHG
jgi:hypothetical protein